MKPVLLLTLFVSAVAAQDQLWHLRNLGKAFYENPTTQKEAVEQFRQALALNPKSARERVNYGLALLKAGDTKEAVAVLEVAQKQDPTIPHTWFNLGVVAKREGEYDRALAQMRGAEKLIPSEPTVHHNLGAIYKLLGKPDDATKEFEIAEKLNPNLAAPHFQLYNAYRQAGRASDAARELAQFQEAKKRDTGAPIAENMEGNNYTEIYDVLDAALPPVLPVEFQQHPLSPGASSGAGIHGDFDNDGLLDVCMLTDAGAILYRNEGNGKRGAPIPVAKGKFWTALWIDYDHDYDLDLMLFGEHSVLMRNNGDGTWTEQQFPFAQGNPRAAKLFALRPETAARDFVVAYADHEAVLYRDNLNGKFTAVPLPGVPAAERVSVADWNRDGTFDLAIQTAKGFQFFKNNGGTLEPLTPPPSASALASFAVGEWVSVASNTALTPDVDIARLSDLRHPAPNEKTLRIAITGIKNVKSAVGATVEVKSGALYQKKIYEGTPLFFSMRNYPQADTVRITWPNGLIQNEPQQPTGGTLSFKEAQRLSGSCPMIFTWDGAQFQFITDVLGVAPLGASSGDGQYFPVDHREHIRIPSGALQAVDGQFPIRITEELREVSYIDQVQLLAVDHPASEDIYTNDKFKAPPFPEFRLFSVSQKIHPTAAHDDHGTDIRQALLSADRVYPTGFTHDSAGVAALHHINLDFRSAAQNNRAVLYLTGWVDWADGSTFLGTTQRKGGGLVFPYLQVKNEAGQWQTVIEDMGIPAGKPKTVAIDLTGKFLSAFREIRIVTNLCVYWDEIFLTDRPEAPAVHITAVDPASAHLQYRGFSAATIDRTREQPEAFNYSKALALSNWNPTQGNYTRYGDVRPLLSATDDQLLIMGSGDEVQLQFPATGLPNLPKGWTRDYLLLVDGWAKDADANTAFGESVEPLPFHGMSAYPYRSDEHFPDDAAHREYRKQYLTRPALNLIRPLAHKVTE